MDANRFDALIRSLTSRPSRRGLLVALGGGVLAVLPIANAEDAAGKKKRKKKKKKRCQPNCTDRTCGSDGCGGTCGACGANQVCQGGTCCMPEPLAATCGGRCGVWTNNCGQSVPCLTCPGNRVCLSNGSCATVCPPACPAPPICGTCSATNTEGATYCVAFIPACPTQPTCRSTAECPPGTQCQSCPAPAGPLVCVPLCAAG